MESFNFELDVLKALDVPQETKDLALGLAFSEARQLARNIPDAEQSDNLQVQDDCPRPDDARAFAEFSMSATYERDNSALSNGAASMPTSSPFAQLGAWTAEPNVRVSIRGEAQFVQWTKRALDLLWKLKNLRHLIFGNIAQIRQTNGGTWLKPGIRKPIVMVDWDNWGPGLLVEYAGALAHEAYHNEIYRRAVSERWIKVPWLVRKSISGLFAERERALGLRSKCLRNWEDPNFESTAFASTRCFPYMLVIQATFLIDLPAIVTDADIRGTGFERL